MYAKSWVAAQSQWNRIGIGNFNNSFWITVPPPFFVGWWLGVKRGLCCFTLKKTISTHPTHAHTLAMLWYRNQLLVRTFWLQQNRQEWCWVASFFSTSTSFKTICCLPGMRFKSGLGWICETLSGSFRIWCVSTVLSICIYCVCVCVCEHRALE